MPTTFILDANVLLHNPTAFKDFADGSTIVIPIEVIEQIDKFKHEMSELGRNSRTVVKLLDDLRLKGRLRDGVQLEGGGCLRVICEDADDGTPLPKLTVSNRVDRRLLTLALRIQAKAGAGNVVVVTKDVNLRIKADVLGIKTQDYDVERFPDADQYLGWYERMDLAAEQIDKLRQGAPVRVKNLRVLPNEYAMLCDPDNPRRAVPGRFEGENGKIWPISPIPKGGAAGIRPLNLGQTFALNALMDDDINLVTLTGKAGTGKTLLALAAALYKVFKEDRYNRVLVFRPTISVGRDIGFLPGDVADKMRPWMQPIFDALELIREEDRRGKERILPPDIMECEEVSVEPLTFIRGRSIPRQYIIIDEAQNLTPLEVKTVITRVGKGTKIVLTGDPHQIDNPYVEALSNGLTYLVDRFRGSPLAAHIGLAKGERSVLAETASDLL